MLSLGVALYKDFELLDVYGPLERFGSLGGAIRIITIAETAGPVASTQGPETVARETFASAPKLALLLVPGGIGTIPTLANEAYLDFLRTRAPDAQVLMSVCSGSALLAKAGLLDGKQGSGFRSVRCLSQSGAAWLTPAVPLKAGVYPCRKLAQSCSVR